MQLWLVLVLVVTNGEGKERYIVSHYSVDATCQYQYWQSSNSGRSTSLVQQWETVQGGREVST